MLLDQLELYRVALEFESTHEITGTQAAFLEAGPLRIEYALPVNRTESIGERTGSNQCELVLGQMASRLKLIRSRLDLRTQQLQAAHVNPAQKVRIELFRLQAGLKNERDVIKEWRSQKDSPNIALYVGRLEAQLAAHEGDVAVLKGPDPHKALVSFLDRNLARRRVELAEIEEEQKLVRAAERVALSVRVYSGDEDNVTSAHLEGAKRTGRWAGEKGKLTAEAPCWTLGDAGDARLYPFSRVRVVMLLAEWEDLLAVERLIRESRPQTVILPLRSFLARLLWSFWPEHSRPTNEVLEKSPTMPPIRSNMLVHIHCHGNFELSVPARVTKDWIGYNGNAQHEETKDTLDFSWSNGPRSDFKYGRLVWPRGNLFEELTKVSKELPWAGDPLDLTDGWLHMYGQPVQRSFRGMASARFDTNTIPDAEELMPNNSRWSWTWSLQHTGDESGLQPQTRPPKS